MLEHRRCLQQVDAASVPTPPGSAAAIAGRLALSLVCFLSALAVMKRYRLDIFQSTPPDLTEIFWLLPFVPETQWGDTSVELPRSPLPFKRMARVKEGDFNDWREVPSA